MNTRTLNLAVRDFIAAFPKKGSLTANLSSRDFTMDIGQEIHEELQKRLSEDYEGYSSEFSLKGGFETKSLKIKVNGRADGFYAAREADSAPTIEEIKSSFRFEKLLSDLEGDQTHPYYLQLATYGFLYEQNYGVQPNLQLRIVCSRTAREEVLKYSEKDDGENWLKILLEHYERLFQEQLLLKEKRKQISASLNFPFDKARQGQGELIDFLHKEQKKDRCILIQAPTGLGKTAGVLFPALKKAAAQGRQLIFTAPKNALFKNAIDFFQSLELDLKLNVLVITSKEKSCIHTEVNCSAESCPFAKDYYDKSNVVLENSESEVWDKEYFRNLGTLHALCPYELANEKIYTADIIICDYNYLFSMQTSLIEKIAAYPIPLPKPVLIIDEYHNLATRVCENLSPELDIDKLGSQLLDGAGDLEDDEKEIYQDVIEYLGGLTVDGERLLPLVSESDLEPTTIALQECLVKRLRNGEFLALDHPLVALYLEWAAWVEIISLGQEYEEIKLVAVASSDKNLVKALCTDAGFFLKDKWQQAAFMVGFSATLKPFSYYANITGIDPEKLVTEEFASPFPPSNKKVLVIPQIETTFRRRRLHHERIVTVIEKVRELQEGHYFVFFPSYQFMFQMENLLGKAFGRKNLWLQQPGTSLAEINSLLAELKANKRPKLICAVQGGQLAEGLDYKGYGMKGAFVIGPALPAYSFEKKITERYFQKKYADGRHYTFTYPAMAKSVQAAGRVVRSPSEKAVVVLMDSRFLQNSHRAAMPTDWNSDKEENLVSNSILRDVSQFWESPSQNTH